ncbi:MAG: phosphoribosylformylglycinamidine synthase subunit PurL [Deltaproteobacteria bacterium]|nr:phosphoribosylformylglycinamidine synthase subunit PurL [Deltaproteobacteria bacterium]
MTYSPEILKQHNLTGEEYSSILKILGREPNLVELGIFSVMWSEHCSYKSSRKFLKNFPTTGPRVIQGPGENAGVVDIGDGLALVFKMESHNHPSFIEPYQGAATGVGGILRDVFTMGARPIAVLDSLRFGAIEHPKTSYLVGGVVAGIAGYGNCMGIPTVGGDVSFDECYNGNILVNAMTVGLVRADRIFKGSASGPGNLVIYVGSKTGRDGIHGATMASDSFDESSGQKRPTVQVGDPFTEKLLLEACLELMAKDAIVGIQDMGAAGLTSSSFEMASRAGTGLSIDLDKVPLREEGMTPYEIMLSESQERMLLVCKPGAEKIVKEIFDKWDLDSSVIGRVAADGICRARFKGEEVVSLPVSPLAHGAPVYDRPRKRPENQDRLNRLDLAEIPEPQNLTDVFQKLISHPTLASKKWVYRQYDHQVMTDTVVGPGSDSAILRIKGTKKGIAVTSNCNARHCYLNPFAGAAMAVAESGRNLVCSGAEPLAVTDCLNFGNPENAEIMGQFEEATKGISEACRELGTPVVSGNVSFYNETIIFGGNAAPSASGGSGPHPPEPLSLEPAKPDSRSHKAVAIYPTPMIGMVGLLENIDNRLGSFFAREGDAILLLGDLESGLDGSEYLKIIHGKTAGKPQINLKREKNLWKAILEANAQRLLSSAHDLSEGGLALALAECCFGPTVGNAPSVGVQIVLKSGHRPDLLLFGESPSRVIVSAGPSDAPAIQKLAERHGVPRLSLGTVGGKRFSIGSERERWIDLDLDTVRQWWEKGFAEGLGFSD